MADESVSGGNSCASDGPPLPPIEPDAAECCGEGCVRCVFDLYDEALQRYRLDLSAWQGGGRPDPDEAAVSYFCNAIP